ncbi:hypothetical protein GCM10010978_25180 [Compostibacillus humi]|uniref:Uncharacterized protein n=1 Tax=Compostibacillus humi TaxID=1245525 RepID=A0A8J2TNG5_9BACI|nr:hypothetical protein [Compostibacillus humi]GFZ83654.1 hypothetical protein GCM10010978_25180 [Compostibacillus humi]
MNLLATQTYIKVERRVDGLEQHDVTEERTMFLYPDKIVTKYHEFPIKEVLDISYRIIGGKGGLLYLHTLRGVYPFIVQSSPERFVEKYKQYCKSFF